METIILNFLKNIFNISQPTTTQLYTFLLFIITVATLIFCKNKIVIYSQDYPLFQYILDKLRSIMLFIIQLPSFVSIFNLLSWFLLVICTKNGKEQVLIILYAEWNLMLLIEYIKIIHHVIYSNFNWKNINRVLKRKFTLLEMFYYLQISSFLSSIIIHSDIFIGSTYVGYGLTCLTILFFVLKIHSKFRNKKGNWRKKHKL